MNGEEFEQLISVSYTVGSGVDPTGSSDERQRHREI